MGKASSNWSTLHASSPQRFWELLLGALLLLVAALIAWPMLFPRPRVPSVTRGTLPVAQNNASLGQPARTTNLADTTESDGTKDNPAPEYPTTESIDPLISGKVNLNTATLEELEALPRIGEAIAKRIIEGRPYRSLDDLDNVKGIGDVMLEILKRRVTW